MKYRVTHTTNYHGDQPVSIGLNEAWLQPRETEWQRCQNYQLEVLPSPTTMSPRTDYYGNRVWVFSFNHGYDAMTVTSKCDVLLSPRESPTPDATPPWESVRDQLRTHATPMELAAFEFAFDSPRVRGLAALTEYARASFAPGRPILAAACDLMNRIHHDFQYDPRATTVTTPVDEVFRLRRGVCQDFAHLQIAALRSFGLAARYVSGYLRTRPAPGKPRLIGADASHAWLSIYCGSHGWIDLDPTNNSLPNQEHITIAWGRDYADVTPLKGIFIGGGQHSLNVNVDVIQDDRNVVA